MEFEYKSIQYKDKNGKFLLLKPVSITRLIEFSWKMQSLLSILNQVNLTLTEAFHIDSLADVKTLTEDILKLCNLDFLDFNVEQIEDLICNQSLLQDLNKLNQKTDDQETIKSQNNVSLFEYVSKMITMLIHLELALDLKEAYEIADQFPADQLQSLINARITQVDPEYEKREQEEKSKELSMQNLIEDLKTGFNSNKPKFILPN
jgi:hypothetical protein